MQYLAADAAYTGFRVVHAATQSNLRPDARPKAAPKPQPKRRAKPAVNSEPAPQ
jgi:hypothetical protein